MAGHVFISYSRTDIDYVATLADLLTRAGVPVWVDHEVDYGDTWVSVICEKIDTCEAFVPVMTPKSWSSTWVAREIARAELGGKLILPMLLEGQVFFTLGHLHYEDVRGGVAPKERFIERLRRATAGTDPTAAATASSMRATAPSTTATAPNTQTAPPTAPSTRATAPSTPAAAPNTENAPPMGPATPAPDASPAQPATPGGDRPVTYVEMPRLGESVTEGTVTRWLKRIGDHVEFEEPLLEIGTDKVDIEMPSPASGVLVEILVFEDETAEVGTALAAIAPVQPVPARLVSVTMPALGASITEGFITRWLKRVGDSVEVDEPLLEVSTDKVDTEIPSPATGVLLEIIYGEDHTAEVGDQLGVIAVDQSAT